MDNSWKTHDPRRLRSDKYQPVWRYHEYFEYQITSPFVIWFNRLYIYTLIFKTIHEPSFSYTTIPFYYPTRLNSHPSVLPERLVPYEFGFGSTPFSVGPLFTIIQVRAVSLVVHVSTLPLLLLLFLCHERYSVRKNLT